MDLHNLNFYWKLFSFVSIIGELEGVYYSVHLKHIATHESTSYELQL